MDRQRFKRLVADAVAGSFLQWLIPGSFWTGLFAGVLTVVTTAWGLVHHWPLPSILIAFLAVSGLSLLVANQVAELVSRRKRPKAFSFSEAADIFYPKKPWYERWFPTSDNIQASQLKIEFDQIEPVRTAAEPHPQFPLETVQRRFYGVCIYNSGQSEVENVSVEVEKIEPVGRHMEVIDMPRTLGLRLKFKTGATSMNFPSQLRERVPVISHINSMLISEQLRIESTQGYTFMHGSRRHRLHLKVTGSKVPAATEIFSVWIDPQTGNLQMGRN